MDTQDIKPAIVTGNATDEDGNPASELSEDRVTAFLGRYGRHLALLQACVAMSGSLFMSEALGWPPCVLCWYQRILMYPLTLLILVGILRRDRGLHLYVLPLSLSGACVSLYHYLLVKTDWLPSPPCRDGIPCTVDYLDIFGFINVPFMALTAFLVISFMVGAAAIGGATESEESPSPRDGQAIAAYAIIAVVMAAFIGWGMVI